ncbi:hypothetical protein QH494_04115 [Sphingomonas sp. AR_OL41]|uniref:hypothetical protein n=1 Tax=Sphingomonas sp. AR_OL41 TaxID=3042729 RepID=UPI0024810741|nr:hypothetical protein [Sphingomonas sp. AR_OL41]MDH7971356.1 hypothetical protein [Sphingomonas sp. AR_OL41]
MSKFLLLSLATVVFASPVVAETNAASAKGAVSPGPAPTATSTPEQRFCVTDDQTGSHLPRKTCLTRKQWQSRGFDPLNP